MMLVRPSHNNMKVGSEAALSILCASGNTQPGQSVIFLTTQGDLSECTPGFPVWHWPLLI